MHFRPHILPVLPALCLTLTTLACDGGSDDAGTTTASDTGDESDSTTGADTTSDTSDTGDTTGGDGDGDGTGGDGTGPVPLDFDIDVGGDMWSVTECPDDAFQQTGVLPQWVGGSLALLEAKCSQMYGGGGQPEGHSVTVRFPVDMTVGRWDGDAIGTGPVRIMASQGGSANHIDTWKLPNAPAGGGDMSVTATSHIEITDYDPATRHVAGTVDLSMTRPDSFDAGGQPTGMPMTITVVGPFDFIYAADGG